MENKDNSKVIRTFTKCLFAVLGLFAVLSYGLAAFALHKDKSIDGCVVIVVSVLVLLSIIAIKTLWGLVKCGECPIWGPSATCNVVKKVETIEKPLKTMIRLLSTIKSRIGGNYLKDKILWVGEEPETTRCICDALQLHGITIINNVKTAKDALDSLKKDSSYIAIVFASKNNRESSDERQHRDGIKKAYRNIPIFNKEI